MIKPRVEQRTHLVAAEDLVHWADEDEDSAGDKQVHGQPDELHFLLTTATELVFFLRRERSA